MACHTLYDLHSACSALQSSDIKANLKLKMICLLARGICARSGFVLGPRVCSRQIGETSQNRVLSDEEKVQQERDYIGPPDPVSNIRQIRFGRYRNETRQELTLRLYQIELQEKNHRFWEGHNKNYAALKQQLHAELEDIEREEDTELVLQQFYKSYLADSSPSFKEYSKHWAKSNAKLVWLSFRAKRARHLAWAKEKNRNISKGFKSTKTSAKSTIISKVFK